MLIARAESAAVDAKMVIATCSLMSEESSEGLDDNQWGIFTEWSWVHEAPEGGIRFLELAMFVARPRDNFFQYTAKNVGNDLDKQLAHEDRLRTEIL